MRPESGRIAIPIGIKLRWEPSFGEIVPETARIPGLTEYPVKTAVFRIGISGESMLVCVPMPSLQSACALETRLNAQAGKNAQVQFLGRFEDVCHVTTINEVERLMLCEMDNHDLSRFRKRRQSDRMQAG